MRAVVAIVFALVLALAQSVSARVTGLATGQPGCRACRCAARNCCLGKSDQAPAPVPAAPANTLSPNQHHLLLSPGPAFAAPPVPPATRLSSVSFFLVSPQAVPLYERDCAFLL